MSAEQYKSRVLRDSPLAEPEESPRIGCRAVIGPRGLREQFRGGHEGAGHLRHEHDVLRLLRPALRRPPRPPASSSPTTRPTRPATWCSPTPDRRGASEGSFADDKKEGYGKYSWGRGPWEGESYEGEYHDDKRDGQGTYRWPTGDVYSGPWKDDRIAGNATPMMLAQRTFREESLKAVAKVGQKVCRAMPVGVTLQEFVKGVVVQVKGEQVAVRILQQVPGVTAIQSPDLFQAFRRQMTGLQQGMLFMLSIILIMSLLLIGLIFLNPLLGMAIGAGFGWYSLSSAILAPMGAAAAAGAGGLRQEVERLIASM